MYETIYNKREKVIRPGGLRKRIFVYSCVFLIVSLCVLPTNSAVVTKSSNYSGAGGGVSSFQIRKLINEKKQKMAQLEQCAKKVNGFKIAGISTLGLTAVGVGGNIALASKNKSLDTQINSIGTKIETQKTTLKNLDDQIAAEKLKNSQTVSNKDSMVSTSGGINGDNSQSGAACTDFVTRINAVKPGCIADSERQKAFCYARFISAEKNSQDKDELLIKYEIDGVTYNEKEHLFCGIRDEKEADNKTVECDLSWYDEAVIKCSNCATKITVENKKDYCDYKLTEVLSGDEDHLNVAAFFVKNANGETGSIRIDNCVCNKSGEQSDTQKNDKGGLPKIGDECSVEDIKLTNDYFSEEDSASAENTKSAKYYPTSGNILDCIDQTGEEVYCMCAAVACVDGSPVKADDAGLAICQKPQ